jgi:glutathione reductase (NADPH)
VQGRGRLLDAHTIEIQPDGGAARRVTAETILIATGGWPSLPEIPGIEHAITSNEALDLPDLPKRIVIVGAGYIAVEFAGIFNGLGAHVTEVVRGDPILRGFDMDVRRHLQTEMIKAGIDIRTGSPGARIDQTADGYRLTLKNGDVIDADLVMYATGRAPNTKNLGLEDVGVAMGPKGEIRVDAYSKTSVDSIYAIGDVTDRMALTPVAIAEAMALVRTLFENDPTAMDYADIATAVFSQPPIGTVGLTEEQAAEHHDITVYQTTFRAMKYTLSGRNELTLMKLIVDKETDRVLGAHMVGADAGEIAQGLGIAFKAGATKADFDATVGIHPTSAEEFVTMRTARA